MPSRAIINGMIRMVKFIGLKIFMNFSKSMGFINSMGPNLDYLVL